MHSSKRRSYQRVVFSLQVCQGLHDFPNNVLLQTLRRQSNYYHARCHSSHRRRGQSRSHLDCQCHCQMKDHSSYQNQDYRHFLQSYFYSVKVQMSVLVFKPSFQSQLRKVMMFQTLLITQIQSPIHHRRHFKRSPELICTVSFLDAVGT